MINHHECLTGLIDVDVTNVQNNETIVFDLARGKWKNTTLGAATSSVTTTDTTTAKVLPTVGFSGQAADAERNGGLEMTKNFVEQDGTAYAGNNPPGAYSQAVNFGPKEEDGTWRMAAVQKTAGTTGTVLSFEKKIGGVWVPQYTIQ